MIARSSREFTAAYADMMIEHSLAREYVSEVHSRAIRDLKVAVLY